MLSVNLQKMLKTSMYIHKYNTRSCPKGNFEVKFCRTKTRSMAISVNDVKLWNDLKIEYHNIKSWQKFKTKLLRKCILMIIINDFHECITNLISSNRNQLICMYFSTN